MTPEATAAPTDIMKRLKAETRARHDATEAIPFSEAITNETLPKPLYIVQLAANRIIHNALESAIKNSSHPALAAVWNSELERVPHLDEDLAHFGFDDSILPPTVRAAAEACAHDINNRAQRNPLELLGFLYVVEGSTLGGTILVMHVRNMYNLTTEGTRYLAPYPNNEVMPRWRAFGKRMIEALTNDADHDAIIDAACDAFDRIGDVLKALSEINAAELCPHAAAAPVVETTNPPAGCPMHR